MHAAEKRLSLGLPIRPAWPARAPNVGQADLAWPLARFAPFTVLVVGAVAIGVPPISVRLADVGPFRERLLARDAGSAAAVGLGAIRGRGRAAVAALRARDDPLGRGLRRDPHLLAPVDHAHERRQRHFLRDDRADLGRAVRLAPLSASA